MLLPRSKASRSPTIADMPSLKLRIFAIGLAGIVAATALACGASSSSSSGTKAPDFILPAANRSADIKLSDFQGNQNVVLVFYRGFF